MRAVEEAPDGYLRLVEEIREIVSRVVPADATVLVVSHGDVGLLELGPRRAWHFPRTREGLYAGSHPPDDAAALAHLKAQQERGAGVLLVPATAFWWFEHYGDLRRYLDGSCFTLWRDSTCAIYELAPVTSSHPGPTAIAPRGPASGDRRTPRVGEVDFSDLRRVEPVSPDFGWERGLPLDRYYIEGFLARHAGDVRGSVLEIADDFYTRRFGGNRVTRADVLHPTRDNPRATIVADLARAESIPSSAFDCVILTQTLQFLYDVRSAARALHRILRPGGILLATFPGISPISRDEWGEHWHWSFTTRSVRRLFGESFPGGDLRVEAHGNVLVATAFLQGLVADELRPEELDHHDPAYEVLITLRAARSQGVG